MAANCCGRRLSELLQEQQEPFLVHLGGSVFEARRLRLRGLCNRGGDFCVSNESERRGVSVSNIGGARRKSILCGAKAVRKALLWDLAGCFSCGARQRFRRLPLSGDRVASEFGDGDKQLSPVSVLQLRSDEESTELSHWDDDDSKPSTSASSPSSDPHLSTFYSRSVRAIKMEDDSKFQRTKREEFHTKTEQAIVSAWERIAADISRIPKLVEIDQSLTAREWRRRIGEEEARRVGESIEAMIFEEVRWEAVRDMLCSSRVCVL